MTKYKVGLKTLLQEGLFEPESYDDLVYKFRKIVGKTGFSIQFKKFTRLQSMENLRQSACMVVNPIIVKNVASLFYFTTVIQSSD